MAEIPALPPGVTLDGVPPPPEGVTLDTAPTWGETAIDSAKGIGKGLAHGVAAIPGMVGDAATGLNSGIDSLERYLGASPPTLEPGKYTPTTQTISDATGISSLPDAKTGIGKAAQNVAEFLPGAMTPGGEGSMLAKLIKFGLAPGLASEGAGQLASAAGASPEVQGGVRLAASLAAPGVTGRITTPLPVTDAAHTANIAALRGEGVTATAGQATARRPLQYLEAQLTSDKNAEQQGQINRAALSRVGINADRLTPGAGGTVDTMLGDIGGRFDRLQAGNTAHADRDLVTDMQGTARTYLGTPGLYEPSTTNAVEGALRRITDAFRSGNGSLSGADYQTLRSNLSDAARGSTDPQKARAIQEIVEHLDDTMGRSIAQHNPPAVGEWDRTRRDYRNALVIEKAAGMAGAETAQGNLTPGNLAAAAKSVYGKRVYLRGQDDFSALTQPAVASLPRLPDSGTAHRGAVTAALATIGGGAGYLAGQHYNSNPEGGNESPIGGLLLGEAGGGALLARLLGRPALMNPATQAYLRNQAMTRTPGLLSLPGAYTAANGSRGLLSPGQ